MRFRHTFILGSLAAAALLAAGCGGGSSPRVASGAGSTTTAATVTPTQLLSFSQCMRSNGVPSFPDPQHYVGGNVKLALWDDRADSPSKGITEIYRLGAARPIMVIVPPGVWHGLRNESGQAAGYINVTDNLYDYGDPDNWRLTSDDEPVKGLL